MIPHPYDYIAHFIISVGMVIFLSGLTDKKVAFFVVLFAGFYKEMSDPIFSYADLFFDIIGTITGFLVLIDYETKKGNNL